MSAYPVVSRTLPEVTDKKVEEFDLKKSGMAMINSKSASSTAIAMVSSAV